MENPDRMLPFEFLLGEWLLDYRVPKSELSEPAHGSGEGFFRRALNRRYVFFDYSCTLTTGSGAAHGIFGWDEKAGFYRYWWFEDSGSFQTAVCTFPDPDTLFMVWQDVLLVQTFRRTGPDDMLLHMSTIREPGRYELVLEVGLTRKR